MIRDDGDPAARVLVGTASWTDKSLLDSGWYPPGVSTPARRLAYYAERFPLVEVDATYYSPPSLRTVEAWRDRTPAGFTFNIKAFSLLTGHPTPARSLYKDLRERLGPREGNLYPRDAGPEIVQEVWTRFLDTLRPLHEAGKLGAVLLQFPPWFPAGEANRRHVLACVRRCLPLRACVEFRHHSWMEEGERERTLGLLASHGVPYVCVDMPQGHASSIPPVVAATADLAVFRFHGHSEKWTSKRIEERFAYLYSQEELKDWAGRIAELAAGTRTTHVLMNNCCADNAQRNAARLSAMVAEQLGAAQTSTEPPVRQ
ncbi:DUF72 domain-containing protein [Sphaerisporangium sp. TRM90804]|uniref:DUF72 domain-containing protein n=1 Tax=Sphaerisporangium sp. TRM90804 TaxID=3031113 RepID=UPI00244D6A29|nr:DUF72 domain-containing protein [Sphaerisporangium sp. TRM90804]MDH2430847.1 DUF72 domain-containing protein [Sphaerisporangium sp. TRM90804]